MCDSVYDAVDADELAGEGVEGDVLVEGQEEVEPLLAQLRHRQPQHRQQDEHAREVQALA
jgi:hypothetical protein